MDTLVQQNFLKMGVRLVEVMKIKLTTGALGNLDRRKVKFMSNSHVNRPRDGWKLFFSNQQLLFTENKIWKNQVRKPFKGVIYAATYVIVLTMSIITWILPLVMLKSPLNSTKFIHGAIIMSNGLGICENVMGVSPGSASCQDEVNNA